MPVIARFGKIKTATLCEQNQILSINAHKGNRKQLKIRIFEGAKNLFIAQNYNPLRILHRVKSRLTYKFGNFALSISLNNSKQDFKETEKKIFLFDNFILF